MSDPICMMIGVYLSCTYPGTTYSQDALIIQPRQYQQERSQLNVYANMASPEQKARAAAYGRQVERCLDIGGSIAQQMACMNRIRR
jgi:hypothetical protein